MVGPLTPQLPYEIGKRGGSHYIRMAQKAGYDIKNSKDVGMIAANLGILEAGETHRSGNRFQEEDDTVEMDERSIGKDQEER